MSDRRPEDSRYAKSHEYVHLDGDVGTIGITDYAQKELGDVVFVELPQVGTQLEAGRRAGQHRVGESRLRALRAGLRRSRRGQRARCATSRSS